MNFQILFVTNGRFESGEFSSSLLSGVEISESNSGSLESSEIPSFKISEEAPWDSSASGGRESSSVCLRSFVNQSMPGSVGTDSSGGGFSTFILERILANHEGVVIPSSSSHFHLQVTLRFSMVWNQVPDCCHVVFPTRNPGLTFPGHSFQALRAQADQAHLFVFGPGLLPANPELWVEFHPER